MEPLSTTASIIATLQLSAKVIQYINAAKGSPKDRKRLREGIGSCRNILQELKDESDDSEEGKAWLETIKTLEGPDSPLGRLYMILGEAQKQLETRNRIGDALKWPFREKDVQKLVEEIGREKCVLMIALENNSRKLLQVITKRSKENEKQLLELVELIKASTAEDASHFGELSTSLTAVESLQIRTQGDINRLCEQQESKEAAKEREEILHWLAPVDYALQHQDFRNGRQTGTGQWLVDSQEYQSWLKSDHGMLFCPGMPGAGKTMLTSLVVDDLTRRYENDPSFGVAYLYCNFRRQDDQKPENLLANLLKQLVSDTDSLKLIKNWHGKRQQPSQDDIARTLRSVASLYSSVFILVDALDELQAMHGYRGRFLSDLVSLSNEPRVKVFATSRFIPDITEVFQRSSSLEIRASKEDVEKYLNGRIEDMSVIGRKPQLRGDVTSIISEAVNGMFILARIYLDLLDDKTTPKAIRSALKVFQKRTQGSTEAEKVEVLNIAYQDAMERINSQKTGLKTLALQVLAWITCAKRPVSQFEVQHALAVEPDDTELDEDNLPDIKDMVDVCAGLVTIDRESNTIRLVHYTTQEYFEGTRETWFPDAEEMIATICITYLSFERFEEGPCELPEEIEDRLRNNELYEYAAVCWGHHARLAPITYNHVLKFFERTNVMRSAFQIVDHFNFRFVSPSKLETVSRLHVASYYGIERVVTTLLQSSNSVNGQDHGQMCALHYAVDQEHENVARLLLKNDAFVDAKESQSWTPLHYAVFRRNEEMIRILDEYNVNVNILNTRYGTPLGLALDMQNESMVRLLIEIGADMAFTTYHETPLVRAIQTGKESLVRLLIEKGADVSLGGEEWSPLETAVRSGNKNIVQLLLEKGADMEAINENQTPLMIAANWGEESIVSILLQHGCNVNTRTRRGTALSLAKLWGHNSIVEILLSHGAI
ncbi:hypothetical protein B0J11DRAFT_581097 [Dendryphion nanum]|uniref:NACHT domain-containing protein n=1 Tax=Dendryphion nanum TaxID=256645 RepID=A0A9P9DNW1_9PLEO|nr:hypothetical protein B0J11DRAFT_581097 [Dendryphion nanum]